MVTGKIRPYSRLKRWLLPVNRERADSARRAALTRREVLRHVTPKRVLRGNLRFP
jgi:hypothetical protein